VRIRLLVLWFSIGIGAPFVSGARAQALADAPDASPSASTTATAAGDSYRKPSQQVLFRNYAFDLLGPYPIFTSAATGAIHQATDNPPEWGQGGGAFARRFGSSYGIAIVETTARYSLAEAMRIDTLYYGCTCKRILPRLGHAVLSSFTGRRGADGHRVFSLPSVAAPYAGTFTATYAWYPDRFGAKDAFRMGNNGFLSYVGGNIANEFLFSTHGLLSHAHLPIRLGSDTQDQ